MLRARLQLSAMSRAAMISSSASSSVAMRNPSLSFSSSPRLFNGVPVGNRVSFSVRFSHTSLRCYASSPGFDKIRVQNPIVEMDGQFPKCYNHSALLFSDALLGLWESTGKIRMLVSIYAKTYTMRSSWMKFSWVVRMIRFQIMNFKKKKIFLITLFSQLPNGA